MIPRFFAVVQESVAMRRVKDPCPFRLLTIVPDADLADATVRESVLALDSQALAVFEWDLYHGCSFKFACCDSGAGQTRRIGFAEFDNEHLRALLSQKLSDRLFAWCIEKSEGSLVPSKEVRK